MKAQVASPETSPLSREEEQADVIRRLEEDIIFGRFAPGSRLVEDGLMARYRASRHFVRQGLFQLERKGIVLREYDSLVVDVDKDCEASKRKLNSEEWCAKRVFHVIKI